MVSETGHFTAASLTFLPQPHEYRLPDGRVVPSVTTILKAVGASTNFEAIAAASRWRGERIEAKRDIGTALHADCHAYDDNDLVWATVDPRVLPFLECWPVLRENLGLTALTRERRVFHPELFYCGTLDGLFHLPDGRVVLLDIKTGDPRDAGGHLQTAAYEAAYRREHPDARIDERWCAQLIPGRSVPYAITNYTARQNAWQDVTKWQACLTVFYEQPEQLRKAS